VAIGYWNQQTRLSFDFAHCFPRRLVFRPVAYLEGVYMKAYIFKRV